MDAKVQINSLMAAMTHSWVFIAFL